jgi:ElaB/YqjD/DUF883 family membrane-anchored ribosome-binding protein
MEELIKKITTEAGISLEQATKAFHTVVDHVKSMLPPAFASNIDSMIGNKPADATGTTGATSQASMMDKAGDMAGNAKDKLTDMAGDAKEKLTDLAGDAKEKFAAFTTPENLDKLKEQAEDKFEDLKDQAGDMAKDALDKLKGLFNGGGDQK